MLFRANSNLVGRDVHQLLSNANVTLFDQDSGVMDGVSELSLEDEGLKSSFHELGGSKSQDEIQFLFVFL